MPQAKKTILARHYHKHASAIKQSQRDRYQRYRIEVLRRYGGKCACCGYADLTKHIGRIAFLQLDHVNGGGYQKRARWKELRGPLSPKFRILCWSCNVAMLPGETVCEWHKWQRTLFTTSAFPHQ
jgi:hypothetical protein